MASCAPCTNPLRPTPPRTPYAAWRSLNATRRPAAAVTALRGTFLAGGLADELLDRWERALTLPKWPGPAVWIHGDLHPANLVVDNGQLSAVIDFGDLTAGDPATDLAVAWSLLDTADQRHRLRTAAGYAADDDTWGRARGWAVAFAAVYLANSADNPTIAGVGRHLLRTVLSSGE